MIKVVTQTNSESIWCQSQLVLVRTFWGPLFYKRLTQNFFCEHGMYSEAAGSESLLTSFSVICQTWICNIELALNTYYSISIKNAFMYIDKHAVRIPSVICVILCDIFLNTLVVVSWSNLWLHMLLKKYIFWMKNIIPMK